MPIPHNSFSELLNDKNLRKTFIANSEKLYLTITISKELLNKYLFDENFSCSIEQCPHETGDSNFIPMFLGQVETLTKSDIIKKKFKGTVNPPILLIFELGSKNNLNDIRIPPLLLYPFQVSIAGELSKYGNIAFAPMDYKVKIGNGERTEYIKSMVGLFYGNFDNYKKNIFIDRSNDKNISNNLKFRHANLVNVLNSLDEEYRKCELRYKSEKLELIPFMVLYPDNTLEEFVTDELNKKEIAYNIYAPSSDNSTLLRNMRDRFNELLN